MQILKIEIKLEKWRKIYCLKTIRNIIPKNSGFLFSSPRTLNSQISQDLSN